MDQTNHTTEDTEPREPENGHPDHKHDPVVYTIRLVADPRWRRLLSRLAYMELHRKIRNRSGVDWEYWRAMWPGLSFWEREYYASIEIVPALLEVIKHPPPPLKKAAAERLARIESRKIVEELVPKKSLYEEAPPDDPDLAVLWWARENAKSSLQRLGTAEQAGNGVVDEHGSPANVAAKDAD